MRSVSDYRTQYWHFEATRFNNYTVTVRCGQEPFGRPVVGHLTLQPFQWTILKDMLRAGEKARAAEADHAAKIGYVRPEPVTVEIVEHERGGRSSDDD